MPRDRQLLPLLFIAAVVALLQPLRFLESFVGHGLSSSSSGHVVEKHSSSGRGRPLRFMGKIMEVFGLKDEEAVASGELGKLASFAAAAAQAELLTLREARAAMQASSAALSQAMASFKQAELEALEACERGWQDAEDTWDDSLKSCAAPVIEKASVADAAMSSLEAAAAMLSTACESMEINSMNRTAVARGVVEKLAEQPRARLADAVKSAAGPGFSDGEPLRFWVLARAEVTDAKRQISMAKVEVTEAATIAATLRARRTERSVKAPAPVPAAASATEEEADSSSFLIAAIGAVLVIGVIIAALFGSGQTVVLSKTLSAPPAVVTAIKK